MTEAYLGEWTIARSITGIDCAPLDCTGSATLQCDTGWLRYDERVAFRLGQKLIRATRAYRFTRRDGTIHATFSDGSPFFALTLDAWGTGRAVHQCGPDRYALKLTLRELDWWTTRWDVSGTKHQRIVTEFKRA